MFPFFIIKILVGWYCDKEMSVRWGHSKSNCFHVCNGVKQGGIISSILFNVYMDELSINLNTSSIGGDTGGDKHNYLCYANEISLITLSFSGMQRLLIICSNYAFEHSLLYNSSKSKSLCFKHKKVKFQSHSLYMQLFSICYLFRTYC